MSSFFGDRLLSVKIVSINYKIINKEEKKSKLEILPSKKDITVVYKEDIAPLSEQLGLVQPPISSYLSKIEIPCVPDAGDRALLHHFIEKYIKNGHADDVFLQIAANNFDTPLDFRKIYYLSEGVKLVEPLQKRWRVAPSLGRPYLIELLKRCGENTQSLIDKINHYISPENERENELWRHFMNRYKPPHEEMGGITAEKVSEESSED